VSSNPCGCDPEANHFCDGCTINALTQEVARRVNDAVILAENNRALGQRIKALEQRVQELEKQIVNNVVGT
jgi:hypothetical protein